MRILSAAFHLFLAYPATEEVPSPDLESRVLKLSKGNSIPDKFTYKQSYQLQRHSQEGPLLAQFNGKFGIADVIGYYDCETEDLHGSTTRLSNAAQFWNLFSEKNPSERKPEERHLHCIGLSGEGNALIDLEDKVGGIPSPGELMEIILHGIIGK